MTAEDNRRGKITDEHREEARRLRAIWDRTRAARDSRGAASQEAFGDKYEIGNQAAVGFFLNGKTALSLKAAIGFARGLEVPVQDFSPRLAATLPSAPAVSWPLRRWTPEQWAAIDHYTRGAMEDAAMAKLRELESERANTSPNLSRGEATQSAPIAAEKAQEQANAAVERIRLVAEGGGSGLRKTKKQKEAYRAAPYHIREKK